MLTQDFYNQHALDFFEGTVKSDMSTLYRKFESHLHAGDKILDLGCGSGRDSAYFTQQGYHVTAVDNSAALSQLAFEQFGLTVRLLDMIGLD